MVRGRGLEPLRITPLEPGSGVSAISPPAREIDQERNAETADSKVSQIVNIEEKTADTAEISGCSTAARAHGCALPEPL